VKAFQFIELLDNLLGKKSCCSFILKVLVHVPVLLM